MKNLHEYFLLMLVVGVVAYVGNWVGYGVFSLESMAGMLILIVIAGLGQLFNKLIPLNIPSVVYVIAIGIIASLPQTPWGGSVIAFTSDINLLAIATPILAYAGIAIGRSWTDFVSMGWRAMVVSLCVLLGTLVGSAIIAELVLRFQGII
ncbi:hypothetical protein [Alkalihalobacillus sp. 1P02AB]|uniref:hypothetical protein n=1 Tax=Alkalihalobacillus sp. 1P02AB TaxID=3132260 RepID=UPI0039A45BD8